MGNFKAAQSSYEEAIEVDQKIGNKNGLTQSLMSLGSSYLDMDSTMKVSIHQGSSADCSRHPGRDGAGDTTE